MSLAFHVSSYTISAPVIFRTFEFRYSAAALPALLLLNRLPFGFHFIWPGFDKPITHFAAAGFLANASSGPLKGYVRTQDANTAEIILGS